jgi:hypothetical protein
VKVAEAEGVDLRLARHGWRFGLFAVQLQMPDSVMLFITVVVR